MRSCHQIDQEKAIIHVDGLSKPFRMIHMTDAHVSLIDERDAEHLSRLREENHMEKFPNNMHDLDGVLINPADRFARVIEKAEMLSPDLLCLTGDIIHYPSQHAIEFVKKRIEKTGIPVIYTPGNHDWCFSNVPGSEEERQSGWHKIQAINESPLEFNHYDIHGLQFLVIDNSIYQITPNQLNFVKKRLDSQKPTILLMHIPLSLPTLRQPVIKIYDAPLLMADPDWNLDSRERWGAAPDTPETLHFKSLLAKTQNLVAVFAGHVHFNHRDNLSPWAVQYITGPAFRENYRLIEFQPL